MANEIIVDNKKEGKEVVSKKKIGKKKDAEVDTTTVDEEEVTVETEEQPQGTVAKLLSNDVQIEKDVKPQVTPVKMVKIATNQDHKCFIGGMWYCFKQGTQYNVPENVKEILMRAGILQPL